MSEGTWADPVRLPVISSPSSGGNVYTQSFYFYGLHSSPEDPQVWYGLGQIGSKPWRMAGFHVTCSESSTKTNTPRVNPRIKWRLLAKSSNFIFIELNVLTRWAPWVFWEGFPGFHHGPVRVALGASANGPIVGHYIHVLRPARSEGMNRIREILGLPSEIILLWPAIVNTNISKWYSGP